MRWHSSHRKTRKLHTTHQPRVGPDEERQPVTTSECVIHGTVGDDEEFASQVTLWCVSCDCDSELGRGVIGAVAGLNRIVVTLHFFDARPPLGLGLLKLLGRDAVRVVAVVGGTGEANGCVVESEKRPCSAFNRQQVKADAIVLMLATDRLSVADGSRIGDMSDDGLNHRRAENQGKELRASDKLSGGESRGHGSVLLLGTGKEG